MGYSIGRSGFNLGAVMNRQKQHVRAELYIAGDLAKTFFGLLKNQKAEIKISLRVGHLFWFYICVKLFGRQETQFYS